MFILKQHLISHTCYHWTEAMDFIPCSPALRGPDQAPCHELLTWFHAHDEMPDVCLERPVCLNHSLMLSLPKIEKESCPPHVSALWGNRIPHKPTSWDTGLLNIFSGDLISFLRVFGHSYRTGNRNAKKKKKKK